MVKTENGSLKIVIFLLVGMILSGIISIMYLTGSINFTQFYDMGELYDIPSSDYKREEENWRYNYSTKLIEVGTGDARHFFENKSLWKNWNYFCLELKNVSQAIPCQVEVLDRKENTMYTLERELQNGSNVLTLQGGSIYGVYLVIKEPCSFHISRMQFREKLQEFGWQEILLTYGVVFAIYLGVLLLFLFIRRNAPSESACKNRGCWMEKVQEAYSYLLYQAVGARQNLFVHTRPQIRRLLFLISLLLVWYLNFSGWKWQILPQRRSVFLLGFMLLLIAFFSGEVRGRTVNWKNPLMYAWLIFWLMCLISEFVVGKLIQNVGIFMLGCMGPLYMAWSSMNKPERLLKDLLAAIRWSYWLACFFCIFFRPYMEGMRYIGIYSNTNLFAGYLVTVNIAFLIRLDENLNKETLKNRMLWNNILALVSLCGFLLLTESITSMAAYVAEWIVFIWKQFPNEKTRAYQRNIRRTVVICLCSAVLVGIPGMWCLNNIPRLLNTSLSFPGDSYLVREHHLSLVAKADSGDSGISERILSKIQSGDWDELFTRRTEIWKTYVRHLNLFGHKEYLVCFGYQRTHAHNILLQTMYYYGVFAAVPYLVMLYYSVKYGILAIFNKRRSGFNLFFLMAAVNFIVQGLAEDIMTPYLCISWLVYFIALGGLVNQPGNKRIRG